MLSAIQDYLGYQGEKYIKPEKAGPLKEEMEQIRYLAQSARKEFQDLAKRLEEEVGPFQMERVSQWMNQAQFCRPHFWVYYRHPEDSAADVAMALRLDGKKDEVGITVEVSFVERKKSDQTLAKQHRILNRPITAPLYYQVQADGESHIWEGTEENRLILQELLDSKKIRKVLVKEKVLLRSMKTSEELLHSLKAAFERLLPYYLETKKTDS